MSILPYFVAYLAIGIFAIIVMARIYMWVKMPIHVRWELYPVAHEAGKAHYGGSYMEESEWWKKPRKKSLWGELTAMSREILFLETLRENNRKLWLVSFPFHFGLYLVIGSTMLIAFFSIIGILHAPLAHGGLALLFKYAIITSGIGGLSLGLLGASGLLLRRLTDPDLKEFTVAADIFNLLLFIVVFGFTLAIVIFTDRDFSRFQSFVQNLLAFNLTAPTGTGSEILLMAVNICLLGALMAYIPMTHMSHFIAKYFAYHAIRWNDDPNTPGSEHEKPIGEVLNYPVSWAAAHIDSDGSKTWAEVATADIKTWEKKQ